MSDAIKAFVKKISEDKEFSKKFEGKSAKEVSKLAKKEGYEFTPEEYMDLQMEAAAGGDSLFDIIVDGANHVSETVKKVAPIVGKGAEFIAGVTDRKLNPSQLHQQLQKIYEEI